MFKNIILVSSERPDVMQVYLLRYADLLNERWYQPTRHTIRRVFFAILAGMSAIAFMVVSVVAFMLALNFPESHWQQLIIAPAILLLMTVGFVWLTVYQRSQLTLLERLRHESQQDRRLLEAVQAL